MFLKSLLVVSALLFAVGCSNPTSFTAKPDTIKDTKTMIFVSPDSIQENTHANFYLMKTDNSVYTVITLVTDSVTVIIPSGVDRIYAIWCKGDGDPTDSTYVVDGKSWKPGN